MPRRLPRGTVAAVAATSPVGTGGGITAALVVVAAVNPDGLSMMTEVGEVGE